MSENGRDEVGRFAPGCAGGPGRPRRAVEREYLATLAEACPPESWKAIAERAVTDAQAGDAKAREWLAKFLIGDKPASLTDLAAKEARGLTVDDELRELTARQQRDAEHDAMMDQLLAKL